MKRGTQARRHHIGFPVLTLTLLLGFYFFLHSSLFNITDIGVTGVKTLSEQEIVALSGLRSGVNIFEVDTAKRARAVMRHPRVKKCTIVRHLPSSLEIRVIERTPWAVVPAGKQFLLVDNQGIIIDTLTGWPPEQVPLVTTDRLPSRISTGQRVDGVATISRIAESLPPKKVAVSEYHYESSSGEVTIYTENGVEIRFGDASGLDEKVAVWPEIARLISTSQRPVAYVDLRFKGHPVIKYKGSL